MIKYERTPSKTKIYGEFEKNCLKTKLSFLKTNKPSKRIKSEDSRSRQKRGQCPDQPYPPSPETVRSTTQLETF